MSRRGWLLVAQASASIVLLVLLFRGFDWKAFTLVIARVPLSLYLVALLIVLAGQALYGLRWCLTVRVLGINAPVTDLLARYFVGVFFNNFFPSTFGGDWVKVYYLGQQEGYVVAGATVFIDRFLGALYLVVFSAALLWSPFAPRGPWELARGSLTVLAAMLIGVVLLARAVPSGSLASRMATREGLVGAVAGWLSRGVAHVRIALRHPLLMCCAPVIVVVYFVLQVFVYRWFIATVAGIHLDAWPLLTAVTAIAALSMVPLAINGLGLREQLHVLMLGTLGVPREVAFAVSIMLLSHLLLVSLIGLVLWLVYPFGRVGASVAAAS
jgi:glycosyltransferase 2 family protein